MKQKALLLIALAFTFSATIAQKKSKQTTAYAITAQEKGQSRWAEVRLVDIISGDEISRSYESKNAETRRLNARTGKPIVLKDKEGDEHMKEIVVYSSGSTAPVKVMGDKIEIKDGKKIERIIINDKTLVDVKAPLASGEIKEVRVTGVPRTEGGLHEKRIYIRSSKQRYDQPFATNSAALAYDKKNDRLYFTPMGINQLRYIDLKAKTPTVYYFEDEAFGVVAGSHDNPNQITRMVFASNGKGYALSNNAEHLIEFTTKKKAEIRDLGSLADDASNGKFSVHSSIGYGGDMVADESGNLILITANRRVFKINIETMVATYKGSIKGLPAGYTTNGAVVESGTNIIVTSSTSTVGYYKFDLNTLQAEKISASESVFNASDLANGNLVSEKKKKKDEEKPVEEMLVKDEPVETLKQVSPLNAETKAPALAVYPNPVTNGVVNLSFADYTAGRYQVQILDINGKQLSTQVLNINSKVQVQDVKLPGVMAKGTYLVKTTNEEGKVVNTEKIIVQ